MILVAVGRGLGVIRLDILHPAAASTHRERWHAGLGEAEVVAAEVAAGQVRLGWCDRQAHRFRGGGCHRTKFGALATRHAHVLHQAHPVQAVQVQVGGGLFDRPQRRRHIGRAAQQSLLFGAHPQEHLAALGRMLHRFGGHRQQCAGAGGVVDRAVEDGIALGALLAHVIPVGRVDHHFVLQLRIGARHHAGHVELFQRTHSRARIALDAGVQGHRLEVLVFGGGAQFIEVLAGGGEHLACGGIGHPALQAGADLAFGKLEALGVGPAVLHHAPAVRGRFVGVDQDRAGRTLARRFFKFVGPATVIGQAFAVEALRIRCRRHRVVHHHHQHLALQVHALEVVPAAFFRRHGAVADEHQVRVQRVIGLAVARAPDPVRAELQRHSVAAGRDGDIALLWQRTHAGDLDRLAEAVAVAGLEAHGQRLGLEVGDGQLAAALAGAAALEGVGRQEGHVRAQRRFLDGRGLRLRFGLGLGRVGQCQAAGEGGEDEGRDNLVHGDPTTFKSTR